MFHTLQNPQLAGGAGQTATGGRGRAATVGELLARPGSSV
jgi:hypothetical protein